MIRQISMDDLMKKEAQKVERPEPTEGERVYTIPDDVWESRCSKCIHKNAAENIPIPIWAVHKRMYEEMIPCRIMTISQPNAMPGECMSFAPRMDVYGICETCVHNNIFHEGFCMKEDHAPQRRVYFGQHYGGDEKKRDYYGRHRLSVCDDYKPDQYAKEAEA